MGGATVTSSSTYRPAQSVYPRVGGATGLLTPHLAYGKGLPPRGRGNRSSRGFRLFRRRSTPAWAGQPHLRKPPPALRRVYPRVGGATAPSEAAARIATGLPPRGRGNPANLVRHERRHRSTPAWAGQPFQRPSSTPSLDGLPPRGRGNPELDPGRQRRDGSTPAWAGQPLWRWACRWS